MNEEGGAGDGERPIPVVWADLEKSRALDSTLRDCFMALVCELHRIDFTLCTRNDLSHPPLIPSHVRGAPEGLLRPQRLPRGAGQVHDRCVGPGRAATWHEGRAELVWCASAEMSRATGRQCAVPIPCTCC